MKRLTALILLGAMALLLGACGRQESSEPETTAAPPTTQATQPATASQVQTALETIMKNDNFSGVVSVTQDGKVLAEAANGTAHPKTGEAITKDSLFCVGSVSKQFTAAAVMLLQEDGKLNTADKLSKYYPECAFGDKVTLLDMLGMRSGIAEFYDTVFEDGNYNETPVGELKDIVTNSKTPQENRATLEQWLLAQPLTFEPGSASLYCNSNYFLLARIVEKASGKAYEDFVRERIFTPLGMKNTGYIDEMLDDERIAENPYPNPKTVYVGITMGLGDMISCADDINRWLLSFSGNTLLSRESIEAITANYSPKDYPPYGMGVEPDSKGGFFHTGVFTSYCAMTYANPAEGYTMFIVTNAEYGSAGGIESMSAQTWQLTYPGAEETTGAADTTTA